MTGLEIGKLAGQARHGEMEALRAFITLAKQEGWAAYRGGRLSLNGEYKGIHGWKELAWHVYTGAVRFSTVESGPGP